MFVCFFTRYLKTDAARITKLDIDVFHHEFCKNPVYSGAKRSKVKFTRQKNKSVSVFRMDAISTLAVYIIYTGFSQRTMLLPTAGFSMRLPAAKNIAGVSAAAWVIALLRVLASSSFQQHRSICTVQNVFTSYSCHVADPQRCRQLESYVPTCSSQGTP